MIDQEFHELADGSFVVRASVDLRKLSARLGIAWDPAVEASTIGGLVTEELERIPVIDDVVKWNGYRIEVVRADRRRAKLLEIRRE